MTDISRSASRPWILCCVTLLMPAWLAELQAEDSPLPDWQRGVSRWNGTKYDLPASKSSSPAPNLSDDASELTPYTVPVDPTSGPTFDPPVLRSNPFLPSPEKVDDGPLELKAPIALPKPDTDDATALPDSAPPDETTSFEAITDEANPSVPSATGQTGIEQLPPPAPPAKTKNEPGASESNTTESSSISEKIAAGDAAAEPAPLESEITRWYHYPRRWMRGWDSHWQLGLDASDGNANTLAVQTGLEMKRKTDLYSLGIDIDYRQVMSRNVTTEENGRYNVDYDRILKDTPWSAFGIFWMEWDRFKAFDLRLNLDGGAGYHWIRTENTTLVTRIGAGASREIGAPIDDWIPEAVFGIEAERQLTSRQKLKGKMNYFPAWEDFGDFRLVSDVAWEFLLDGSENLSLRLAATDRYDSTPQGFKPNDIYYTMLLLYKF